MSQSKGGGDVVCDNTLPCLSVTSDMRHVSWQFTCTALVWVTEGRSPKADSGHSSDEHHNALTVSEVVYDLSTHIYYSWSRR